MTLFISEAMNDESFVNFVLPQGNIASPVTSTPAKDSNQRGTPRKYSERDSPGATQDSQPTKKPGSSYMMELTDKEKKAMKAKGMPDWGLLLFDSLSQRITSSQDKLTQEIEKVSSGIDNLETSLKDSIEAKCKEVKEECLNEVERVQEQVSDIAKQVNRSNLHLAMMREAVWECIDQQAKSDLFSRKYNLLFAGIKEDREETESDLLQAVRNQLGRMEVEGHPNLKDAAIVNIHRNGAFKPGQTRPRDIIVKFRDIKEKSAALRGKMKCSKNVYINLDLPKPISAVHRQLKPILKTLDGTPYKEKGRVILKPDCILVDNKRYTLNTIMTLPSNFKFWSSNVRSSDECFAWHGNMCPFSNFFWAPIIIAGILYLFCEQYINAEKAVLFGDDESLKKILMSRDPYECKKFGHRIAGFDQDEWDAKAPEVADICIRAKVDQHSFIKNFLMDTKDLHLAKADKESKWACGLSLDDKNVTRFASWKRIGHAGKVYMAIRSELKNAGGPLRLSSTIADMEMDN